MKAIAGILAAIVTAAALAAGAQNRAEGSRWQMKEFMISVWGGPHDEATAQAFEKVGFNTVMGPLSTLELCRKHGLRLIVMDGKPEDARRLQRDDAIWGWYVRDEPPPKMWPEIAKRVAEFHKADPYHPAYVNLVCSWPSRKFCEMVHPRFLSYDYYQWWWGPHAHFRWLEAHRSVALEFNLPLIVWVEANADPRWEWGKPGATYLPDNEAKLRQSVYTSLAYGVKGIQWFVWPLVFKRSPKDNRKPAPELTQAGCDVAKINRELKVLGPVLVKLKSVAVYHSDPVPPAAKGFPADAPVVISGRYITVGFFAGRRDGRYLLVVNRDITAKRWPKLIFARPVRSAQVLDKATGRWHKLRLRKDNEGRQTVRIVLGKGDGQLLRLR